MNELQNDIVTGLLAIWAAFVGGFIGHILAPDGIFHHYLGGVFQIM